jgi:hypothetical protein
MKSIRSLLREGILFVGSDWVPDENAPEDSVMKGHRYKGKILCINASDFFFWAHAHAVKLPDDCSEIEAAIKECDNDDALGFLLWVARHEKMRPQGAYFSYIPQKFWDLFKACGEYREPGIGNPFDIGEYKC